MKDLFQNLDLYKVIIILSLVLIPAVGYWAYSLDDQIKSGRVAIDTALNAQGELEEIGKFEKAVEEQRANRDTQSGQEAPSLYFQRNILRSAERLGSVNLSISPARDVNVPRKNAVDQTVQIAFKDENTKGGKLVLSREELMVILFNCEAPSPIWNLRELSIRNALMGRSSSARGKAPPVEFEDKWQVDKLVFASRRPKRP